MITRLCVHDKLFSIDFLFVLPIKQQASKVRDYRLYSSTEKSVITGGSAFNIKSESLRLGDFDRAQVENLLGQHTVATGQIFTPGAIETAWKLCLGQPWLINALAYQACFRDKRGRDRSRPIDIEQIEDAKEAHKEET